MPTGSVSIAADGTVTKSGTAGTIYDSAVSVHAALSPAVSAPPGEEGVGIKQTWANIANIVAPSIEGGAPTGAGALWFTNSAPTGWLICDGSAVSRSTYANLFAVLSTTYGVGDGSTTFNLPDFRARSPLGGNNASLPNGVNGALSSRALAAASGAETHTISSGEMPTHTHTLTDPGHHHNSTGNFVVDGGGALAMAGGVTHTIAATTNTVSTGITIANTGGGTAHNNMHPFVVMNVIIKT
jgi:microcystin-dependent protein